MKISPNLKSIFYSCLVAVFAFLILFLIVTTLLIRSEVNKNCHAAISKYEGDCVEALIQMLDNQENSFKQRNDSIWTLGQIGDSRALEILQKHYTGIIPNREKYDESLSQYEMKKALKLIDGGINITHFIWKQKYF